MKVALTLAAVGLLAAGAETGDDDLSGRVQRWLDSWSRLSGRFEQRLTSPTLPADQVESGRFQVSRPDRMRWEFDRPEKKLAMTDGVHTWLYVPSDRQVIRGRLQSLRRDSAVSLLLSSSSRLDEAFVIRESIPDEVPARLELTPRESSEAIEAVTLRVDEATGRVLEFTVQDPSGNQVTWTLTDLKLDPRLAAGLFQFEIPDGVEIQDLDDEAAGTAGP